MSDTTDPRAVSQRVEALLRELGAHADRRVSTAAEELVGALLQLYGAGLDRILAIVHEEGHAGPLFARFAGDDLVASLLILHGLHPEDTETRVRRALDRVRPYLGSHGGDVTLLSLAGGVARLRLLGSCQGCPSSSVTMKLAIERAIEEAAPDVAGIEVEEAKEVSAPALLQIAPPARGAAPAAGSPAAGRWTRADELPPLTALAAGEVTAFPLDGLRIAVCRVGESLYAYRDACPACGGTLAAGRLDGEILTCPGCGRRYDVRQAGRGLAAGEAHHLAPLPLLADQGTVRIAVPTEVA